MFSGIIEGVGKIVDCTRGGPIFALTLSKLPNWGELGIGASIAVNGACLTVVREDSVAFTVELSEETLRRTGFQGIRPGDPVNLERAVTLAQRFDGHLVTGHVDGRASIATIAPEGGATIYSFHLEEKGGLEYLVEKGSVAVDGVSLTVNRVGEGGFDVCVIPHTAKQTLFAGYRQGCGVNLEFDIVAKYLRKWYLGGSRSGQDKTPAIRTAMLV